MLELLVDNIILVALSLAAGLTAAVIFLYYRRRRPATIFKKVYRAREDKGTKESVKGVIRKVLVRMLWELNRLERQQRFFEEQAQGAPDTEAALDVHGDVVWTCGEILRQKGEIRQAVEVAAHYKHTDVIDELHLQEYLPTRKGGEQQKE